MRITRTITIMLIFILIWNILFPCLSNATDNISSIESIKTKYEQLIISEGEIQRQKFKSQFPEFDEKQINSMVTSYLLERKKDFITQTAQTISNTELKTQFLEEADSLGTTFINARYGNVVTQDYYFEQFSIVLDGLSGIFTYVLKLKIVFLPASILQLLGTALASVGTENIDNPSENIYLLTLDSIFFNKVSLTDINIFNLEKAGPSNITNTNVIYKMRENIAKWYYAIRNFAICFRITSTCLYRNKNGNFSYCRRQS